MCMHGSNFLLFLPGPHGVLAQNNRLLEQGVVVVNSKLEFAEAESSKLRKDLIAAMDETNRENEKVKELSEALCVENALVA